MKVCFIVSQDFQEDATKIAQAWKDERAAEIQQIALDEQQPGWTLATKYGAGVSLTNASGSSSGWEVKVGRTLHLIPTLPQHPRASSEFMAELIANALKRDISRIVLYLADAVTGDGGQEMIRTLANQPVQSLSSTPSLNSTLSSDSTPASTEAMKRAVKLARAQVAPCEIIVAATNMRPLLGLSGTGADLRSLPEPELNQRHLAKVTQFLQASEQVPFTRQLLNKPETRNIGRSPGSGAGGGIAAGLIALGARVVSTSQMLGSELAVEQQIENADLACVLVRTLNGDTIAESTVAYTAEIAGKNAIPVLCIADANELLSGENAKWGIHGVFLSKGIEPTETGIRLARTWSH